MKKNLILSFIVVAVSLYSCNGKTKKEDISKEQTISTKSEPTVFDDPKTNSDIVCGHSEPFDSKPSMAENGIYLSVEQMPQFPGGDAELMKFIKENLKCPKSMSDNCIQGQVIIRFVVSKDGSVKDVQVLRSLEPACDKEAARIIKSMPKWIPGKQNGKAVDVYYVLPVRFKLENT